VAARFKQFIWKDAKFWREYGVENGVPKYKGRLYAWYGMEPGFGYSSIWIDSQPMPNEIQELLSTLKTAYPDFKGNGCLVTVYPPTSEEDLKHLTDDDDLVLKGMGFPSG
jgi:hypothetical protein